MKYSLYDFELNDRPMTGVKFGEGEFEGVMFTYGKVEFKEDPKTGYLTLSYEYDIFDERTFTAEEMDRFRQMIGDLLVHLIQKGNEENTNVFTGGTDEETIYIEGDECD